MPLVIILSYPFEIFYGIVALITVDMINLW